MTTGGTQIAQIQTVQFHYSEVNFLVQNIRFLSEISTIPRNISAIFGSHTSTDPNSEVSDSMQKICQISTLFEDPL